MVIPCITNYHSFITIINEGWLKIQSVCLKNIYYIVYRINNSIYTYLNKLFTEIFLCFQLKVYGK